MSKKLKEEKWIVFTASHPFEYIDWFREKNQAIEKAKKLTSEKGKKHIVALAVIAFEPTAKECSVI